jgi:uncharacterized membrane protein
MTMINYLLTLIGLGIIIPIDITYLTINKNFYSQIIDPNEKINWIYVITTWLLIIISIQLLVLSQPHVNESNVFINGIFLGLAMYGVYNLTSASIYPSKWTNQIIIGDTVWGMSLTGMVSLFLYWISKSNYNLSV